MTSCQLLTFRVVEYKNSLGFTSFARAAPSKVIRSKWWNVAVFFFIEPPNDSSSQPTNPHSYHTFLSYGKCSYIFNCWSEQRQPAREWNDIVWCHAIEFHYRRMFFVHTLFCELFHVNIKKRAERRQLIIFSLPSSSHLVCFYMAVWCGRAMDGEGEGCDI